MEEEKKDNPATPDNTINENQLMEDIERFIERKKLENSALKKMLDSFGQDKKCE